FVTDSQTAVALRQHEVPSITARSVFLVLVAVLLVIVGLVVLLLVLLVVLGVFLLLLALGHADDDERIRRLRLGRLRVLLDDLALGHVIVEDLVLADAETAFGQRRIGGVERQPLDIGHWDRRYALGDGVVDLLAGRQPLPGRLRRPDASVVVNGVAVLLRDVTDGEVGLLQSGLRLIGAESFELGHGELLLALG